MKEKKQSWLSRLLGLDADSPRGSTRKDRHERRRMERKNIHFYLPVKNAETGQIIGQLLEITPQGFSMDLRHEMTLEKELPIRIELMDRSFHKGYFTFIARSKWLRPDPINPGFNRMGFQIIRIAPDDVEIIKRIERMYAEAEKHR